MCIRSCSKHGRKAEGARFIGSTSVEYCANRGVDDAMQLRNHIRELYKYRYLIWKIAWGDFKWRYKNSILGYFWSLLEPLIMLIILYIVFTNLMKVQVEYYQLFLLLGIIMWNFFCKSTNYGLTAIVGNPSLVQKVYFPRDILVISGCITAMLQSIFESLIFVLFMMIFSVPISWTVFYLPIILVIFFVLSWGVATAIAALNVYYRDIQFIWAVVLQAGFFVTPILYPLSIFPPSIQAILLLNPIAQIIITTRNSVLYSIAPDPLSLIYTGIVSLILFVLGYFIFIKLEPRFAEEM
jgi:lipopolysaccharide transport system permease protein